MIVIKNIKINDGGIMKPATEEQEKKIAKIISLLFLKQLKVNANIIVKKNKKKKNVVYEVVVGSEI